MTDRDSERPRVKGGSQRSVERASALRDLREALKDVAFPVERDQLLKDKGDVPVHIAADGTSIPLRSFIANLEGRAYASPAHVAEAVDLNWHDLSDVFTLGAGESMPLGARHPSKETHPPE